MTVTTVFLVIALQTAAGGGQAAPVRTVTATDVRIVQRAVEILNVASAWNQTDRQNCAPTAQTFSLYCALAKAQRDVTGTFDHDSVVMDEARTVIDFVAARDYDARLVNYNNDPATTFVDIQALLHTLVNRFSRRVGTSGTAAAPAAPEGPSACRFAPAASGAWTGSCGRMLDMDPTFTLAAARAITSGAWRRDAQPQSVWAGAIADASPADAGVELGIYPGGTGVLRTQWGWFPVTQYQATPAAFRFTVDSLHEVPPI